MVLKDIAQKVKAYAVLKISKRLWPEALDYYANFENNASFVLQSRFYGNLSINILFTCGDVWVVLMTPAPKQHTELHKITKTSSR